MADVPSGYSAPVFQALLRKRLLLGAPRQVTVIIILLAGIAFIWNIWVVYPGLLLIQGAAVLGTWLDEDWFEIGFRWCFVKKHYEP